MSPDGKKPFGMRPGPRKKPDKEPDQKKKFTLPLWYLLIGVLLVGLIWWADRETDYKDIEYGRFRKLLVQGRVHRAELTDDEVRGELTDPETSERVQFTADRPADDREIYGLLQKHLDGNWDKETSWLNSPLLFWLVPLGLLFLFWRLVLGRMNPVSSAMDFSQSRAQATAQKDVGVSFEDVAGIEECKRELEEVVEFLQNPTKFTRLGGRIPKGVLLVGAPGTGKTLLAKAVAGEAGVTFFNLSGSDFVEMFVGVGAARVRDLFEQAQKAAPAIIFIDELDALGKARGVGMTGGHDEREQTLNALLVQMDGFQSKKGIILLAATNRPEMLDPALLRPGRFDRQVVVPQPDLQDRRQILEVHCEEVKLADSVDMDRLAAMTPGFVGADLANLVNEATLLAARRDKDAVEMEDFQDSIERVVAGLEKRNRLMNEEEKNTVAHHEAGHALVACLLPGADPVRKVSMIPRGVAGLGFTMQMPTEDRYLLKKGELMDKMAVMLGGRGAEEVIFEETSTGAQNDLQKATELAREMVTQYGMWEKLGPLTYEKRNSGQDFPRMPEQRKWSERTMRQIDEAVRSIVGSAHERATQLLSGHKDALLTLAEALREKEVIEEEELRELLGEYGIQVTEPEPGKGQERVGDRPPAAPDASQEEART
ncbi:MAG: ATP-dependent zinc metalloprotease FtsH [Planctomycetota bacterium]